MALLEKHNKLSAVLADYSELIPVINRFGIHLGVGDSTILDLCVQHNLNSDLVLTVVNVYLDENYLPEKNLSLFNAEIIADYFKHTVESYIYELVPNIEKHLNALIAMSGSDSRQLGVLREIFMQFKAELTACLQENLNQDISFPNELLHDLKNILIKHIPPNYNQNLCHAVIFSVTSLEKDLLAHNRLRDKVLKPKLEELDVTDIKTLTDTLSDENGATIALSNHTLLTRRETEILKLIVQGRLNKEIADELNISLNTVLTHRKNIIAKTGIKTVSGLTFYCIQNGLTSV